jgi:hypothetical protein
MTLVLTCLTQEHIVQVADRRLTLSSGALYDDDTNKAVFYGGRVAVAYTGLAQMEGKPTAEWIGWCMKDASKTEEAMGLVAKRAERYLSGANVQDKRFAVVATGWATLRGAAPIRPFMCVVSNFMNEEWKWLPSPSDRLIMKTIFLGDRNSHLLFAAGQPLLPQEAIYVVRLVRRAIEHKTSAILLARIVGDMIQHIAHGTDQRATRVGKGMIIHLLSRRALLEGHSTLVTPLTPETHSFLYVSSNGRSDPFQGAVIASHGMLLTGFCGGSIPPVEGSLSENK